MNNKIATWLAGALSVVVIVSTLFDFVLALESKSAAGNAFNAVNLFLTGLYTIVFAIVGALILARQPRNTVAWLLMAIGIFLSVGGALQDYLGRVMRPVETPDWSTYLFVWLNGWNWWLLLGPLLLILLVFPTGRLLSSRWRWLVALVATLFVTFLIIATVQPEWQDPNSGKSVANPLGTLPISVPFDVIFVPWAVALWTTTMLCVASVVVRYRRSAAVEREQLKWFFYASAVFLGIYAIGFTKVTDTLPNLFGVLFDLAVLFIPVSIGIAILRYHLFDIDLIIRRTLVYSTLTAILALFYFGSVVLLQQVWRGLTGQGSDLAIIISTLGIAALFVPLRNRVQRAIDHRFYRRKYDAAQVLAQFAATVRDEVDLSRLTDELQSVVEETVQPEHVSVWLRKTDARKGRTGA